MKSAVDRESKETVALKIFNKRAMNEASLLRARTEKSLMQQVAPHDNIAKCITCFEDEVSFVIVTELMSCDARSLMTTLRG